MKYESIMDYLWVNSQKREKFDVGDKVGFVSHTGKYYTGVIDSRREEQVFIKSNGYIFNSMSYNIDPFFNTSKMRSFCWYLCQQDNPLWGISCITGFLEGTCGIFPVYVAMGYLLHQNILWGIIFFPYVLYKLLWGYLPMFPFRILGLMIGLAVNSGIHNIPHGTKPIISGSNYYEKLYQ